VDGGEEDAGVVRVGDPAESGEGDGDVGEGGERVEGGFEFGEAGFREVADELGGDVEIINRRPAERGQRSELVDEDGQCITNVFGDLEAGEQSHAAVNCSFYRFGGRLTITSRRLRPDIFVIPLDRAH
jgi:hypothetical protein